MSEIKINPTRPGRSPLGPRMAFLRVILQADALPARAGAQEQRRFPVLLASAQLTGSAFLVARRGG